MNFSEAMLYAQKALEDQRNALNLKIPELVTVGDERVPRYDIDVVYKTLEDWSADILSDENISIVHTYVGEEDEANPLIFTRLTVQPGHAVAYKTPLFTRVKLDAPQEQPHDSDLWPEQNRALNNTISAFNRGKIAMFIVGQRGGKSKFLHALGSYIGRENCIGVDVTLEQAEENFKGFLNTSYASLEKKRREGTLPEVYRDKVFLLAEHFWHEASNTVAMALHELGARVVMVSSRGAKEYELGEMSCETYRAASWDWNPLLTYGDFEEDFKENFPKAARDFGLYDSKNKLAIDYLSQFKR